MTITFNGHDYKFIDFDHNGKAIIETTGARKFKFHVDSSMVNWNGKQPDFTKIHVKKGKR